MEQIIYKKFLMFERLTWKKCLFLFPLQILKNGKNEEKNPLDSNFILAYMSYM